MGTSTRPRGPRTGLVTPGCYAAALGDCDGADDERALRVEETPQTFRWEVLRRRVSTLAEKVLCLRHNRALSPLDTMIGNFYKVLADARKGREVGAHPFEVKISSDGRSR